MNAIQPIREQESLYKLRRIEEHTNTTWLEGKQGNVFSRGTGYGPITPKPKADVC